MANLQHFLDTVHQKEYPYFLRPANNPASRKDSFLQPLEKGWGISKTVHSV